jgi:hypothetical protein
MFHVPRPMADTFQPVLPNARYSMVILLMGVRPRTPGAAGLLRVPRDYVSAPEQGQPALTGAVTPAVSLVSRYWRVVS